ncbi:hypothetical protein GCM10022217_15980 [Chryseobacterium ginsenosidimutans]|uniref:hypothetical protein n=1 Tax=Chryseobacterium ginsenosidimutans TaxID=687846 RepID=UPI0031D37E05
MNEIIIKAGRYKNKNLQQIFESDEYKEVLERIRHTGVSVETLNNTLKDIYKNAGFAETSIKRLIESAALLNLRAKSKELQQNWFIQNHPNPANRQYRNKKR